MKPLAYILYIVEFMRLVNALEEGIVEEKVTNPFLGLANHTKPVTENTSTSLSSNHNESDSNIPGDNTSHNNEAVHTPGRENEHSPENGPDNNRGESLIVDDELNNATFEFTLEIMKQIIPKDTKDSAIENNIAISPYNIFNAFLTLYLGTDGQSRKQLSEALHIQGLDDAVLHKLRLARQKQNSSTIFEADRIYHEKSLDIEPNYQAIVGDDLEAADFVSNPDQVTKDINQWVSNKTRHRIPELLTSPLTSDVRLMILSTIYFKSEWDSPFFNEATKLDDFTNHLGEIQQVHMMFQEDKFPFDDSDVLRSQVLALPYVDARYSLVIFLPHFGEQTISNLIAQLTVESVRQAVDNLSMRLLQVKIPKFKINTNIGLVKILQQLKITDVFDSARANLTRMTQASVYVDQATHVGTIEVNENGTIASAVTAFKIVALSLEIGIPTLFSADHPFLYMIYDHQSQKPIFTGVVINPSVE